MNTERMPTSVALKYIRLQEQPVKTKQPESYGSKETDLLVQKIRLEGDLKDAREKLVEFMNLLADAQDDANELADSLGKAISDGEEVRAAVVCWDKIRKSFGNPEPLMQQLTATRRLLSEVAKPAPLDTMAEEAVACIEQSQERLQAVLDASEMEDTSLPSLVAALLTKLKNTKTQLTEGDEIVQDSQQLLEMTRSEVVRLQSKINEEKCAAEEAAKLRATLAQQLDIVNHNTGKEQRRARHYAGHMAAMMGRQCSSLLLSRYYRTWNS
eukprot:TRINITY_DN5008_c0_g1_i1.p1 TRINITY_DN5008_c0_g1~~TRINITY_DN5008_c0_g1_i1.p1  ORF type:complete len:269 (+),score=71.25 TRINITY_DN5008_c0_g1_i1:425-1231(+)